MKVVGVAAHSKPSPPPQQNRKRNTPFDYKPCSINCGHLYVSTRLSYVNFQKPFWVLSLEHFLLSAVCFGTICQFLLYSLPGPSRGPRVFYISLINLLCLFPPPGKVGTCSANCVELMLVVQACNRTTGYCGKFIFWE